MQVRLRRELPTDCPDPSTERQARRHRMALEGAQAMKEAGEKAASIRANMARLRKLRLSKEAAEKQPDAKPASPLPDANPAQQGSL
jgi:hypothetical protein